MKELSNGSGEAIADLRRILDMNRNFDILEKHLLIAGRSASLFFIDGLVKDDILEKILEYFYSLNPEDLTDSLEQFQMQHLPYIETEVLTEMDAVIKNLLSGVPCLFCMGSRIVWPLTAVPIRREVWKSLLRIVRFAARGMGLWRRLSLIRH